MSKFYSAKYIIDNKLHSETIYMDNIRSVRNELGSRNVTIISIKEKKTPWWKEEIISNNYKNRFLRAISFHVEAGMSAPRALSLIIKEEDNTSIREKLEMSEEILRRGGSFSEAIDSIGFFSQGVIALLTAGEQTGTLPNAINTATTYLDETKSQNKGFITSIIWFITEFSFAILGALSVQKTLLPWIEKQLTSTQIEDLEAKQRILDSISTAYIANGVLTYSSILLIIIFSLILLGSRMTHKGIKEKSTRILSALPGMKPVIYDSTLYIHMYLISHMLNKGVPFSECLKVCRKSTKLNEIKGMWDDIILKLNKGFSISHAFEDAQFITRAEKLEIQSHQNAQQLARITLSISNERKVASREGKKRAVMTGLIIAVGFSVISLGIAIWAFSLQSSSINLLIQ